MAILFEVASRSSQWGKYIPIFNIMTQWGLVRSEDTKALMEKRDGERRDSLKELCRIASSGVVDKVGSVRVQPVVIAPSGCVMKVENNKEKVDTKLTELHWLAYVDFDQLVGCLAARPKRDEIAHLLASYLAKWNEASVVNR